MYRGCGQGAVRGHGPCVGEGYGGRPGRLMELGQRVALVSTVRGTHAAGLAGPRLGDHRPYRNPWWEASMDNGCTRWERELED
jgi:hypothetical protein